MELKYETLESLEGTNEGSNRTFMELKLLCRLVYVLVCLMF